MVRKILNILGLIFLIFGVIGLVLEISNLFSKPDYDIFGLILALIFIMIGYILFRYRKNKVKSRKNKDFIKAKEVGGNKLKRNLKIINVIGIIISTVNILIGLLIMLYGGVIMSSLFSKAESGWGILGFGISFIGLLFIIYGAVRVFAYVSFYKFKIYGYFLILIIEIITLLAGIIMILAGYWMLFIISNFWSVFIIIYLLKNKRLIYNFM